MPLGQVFWHESSHWIKSANPELWEKLRKTAGITDAQRKAYLEDTGRTDLTTDAEIDEEIISDYFEDALKREGFFSKIGRKDPSLVQRVIAWLQDAMGKFFEYFNNPKGKLTNDQKQRMAHELGRVAGKLVNQNGQKIFRYNNRTHALTLPDGRSLRSLSRTADSAVDFSSWVDDNDNEISQRVFDKYLNDGIMKMVRDTVGKEIGEHVNLADMSDPVKRDKAREDLPYIKKLRTQYHDSTIQNKAERKNHFAAKIEYARRCFNNDERIRTESLNPLVRNDGQRGIRGNRSEVESGINSREDGGFIRPRDRGVSQHVPGGQSASREHFLKLYEEAAQEVANERHSGKRGAFSNGKTVGNKNATRSERKFYRAVPATDENMGIAQQLGGVLEHGQMVFRTAEGAEAYDRHLQNMGRGKFKYSFAGEKAKTADKESLKKARRLRKILGDNAADTIYQKTGWFWGKDGKWRFEIPDNFDKIDFGKLLQDPKAKLPLDEIYDNPALFAAYPKLRKVLVSTEVLPANINGVTDGKKKITLNWYNTKFYPEKSAKTLVHELQHIIQDNEKFASGGDPQTIEADLEHNKNKIIYTADKIKAPYSKKYFDSILAVKKAVKQGNEQAESKARKEMSQAKKELSPNEEEKVRTLAERYYEIKTTKTKSNKAKTDAYWRLGGEQEARYVEERLFDRTGTPKAHDPDALIIYGGKTYAMTENLENKKIASENGDGELAYGSITPFATTANGTTTTAVTNVTAGTDNKGGVSPTADVETNSPSESISQDSRGSNLKYSIDIANASTTEKLKAKIDNFLWNVKNERPRNHMRKLLEKLSGYQIRSGHVAEGIDILVKDISKVIRTKRAYDWERLMPEVGKLVAKRLNFNPTTEQGNYIASWLMDGAPNNTSQAAKDFQRAMRETDDMYRDQLLEVQSIFSDWANRPPEQIVRDAIEYDKEKKPLVDKAKGYLYEGYEQFVEELYPVKQLIDEIEQDRGKKLAADENPYALLRNSRGIAGRAKIMVEGGANAVDALKAAFPNIDFSKYKTPFKTIYEILDSVDALENKDNRKEFSAYLLACSVKDLHKRNAENLRKQAELRDEIDTLEDELDTLTDKKKIKATEKQIKKLQDELDAVKKKFYVTPFDEKTCNGTIAKYKDKYGQAQQDIMRYSRTLLDIMVDSGLLSEEKRAGYLKNFPNHVPMFRKFDENEDKNFGDSLKAMTGSSRDVIDPLNSIIKNTYDFVRRAEKNKAKILLANLARTGGAGTIIEERTFLDEVDNKKPDVNTTITFFENGEKKYLETDPAVVKAVNNLSIPQMSWFMKFLRVGTMLLRNFATVYNPAFAFRNLLMDNQNAWLYNKYGMWSPADFVRGFLSVWNRDADYNEWIAMGGAQASFWSVDRDYTQASLDRLRKGRWGQYKSKPWQLLSFLGEYSELGTRVGYYKKAKATLAAKNGGKIDRSVLLEAALESRDLTDFARGGKSSRGWNNAVAFANASIQGWDKFFRTYDPRQYWSKDPEVKKQWERAMIRLARGSILPTVLCFLINTSGDDDDWYEKDLPDWERQTHWILGEHLRVPKGQDVGLRFFSNLTESMLRYMVKNDPKAFENWWKPAWEAITDFVPTAMQPIIECATNYDMFRKNAIVPARQQKLPEYMQYDNRTSALAKWLGDSSIAKFIAGETGISPAKIDHFIYGYTGKLGQDALRFVENVTGARDFDYSGLTDLPIISGIKSGFLRVPYRNPRILTEYYETLDEQTKLHNEFKLTKKRPEGYNHSLYTKLKKAQEQMQELIKKERKVLDDTKLDGDERDNRQLAIQKKRVALAERVLR